MSNGPGPPPTPPPITRKDGQAGPVRTNAFHGTIKTASLTVSVTTPAQAPPRPVSSPGPDPVGSPLQGVEVEVVGTAKKNTEANGTAKFDAVPAETPLNIKARKLNYGPVPAAGAAFAPGEAVVTQTFTKGQVARVDMVLMQLCKI